MRFCRRMIGELDTATEFTVQEDGKSFALMLDVMYSKMPFSAKSPITQHNASVVLELTRKYDVGSAAICDSVLGRMTLDDTNIREAYVLASEYGLNLTMEKCRAYTKANILKLVK